MNALDIDLTKVQLLQWPQDKETLAQLSLIELQCWMAGQDPRALVYLGQDPNYKKWIYWHYLMPLKIKRMFYKVKRWFIV